jgi:hypothetical protein
VLLNNNKKKLKLQSKCLEDVFLLQQKFINTILTAFINLSFLHEIQNVFETNWSEKKAIQSLIEWKALWMLSMFYGSLPMENTSYSAMFNIVEPVPPTEPIPSNSRNSVRFRNWVIIMLPSPSHPGYCIQFLNGIPGIESSRNWTEFLPIPVSLNSEIPDRNWVVTRWVRDDTIILEVVIPESDEIPRNSRNSVRFRNWVIIMSPSPSHCGYRIQFPNGIPGIESNENWTEFRGIPTDSGIGRN